MTIAITGADGQLGGELSHMLQDNATELIFPEFDLTDAEKTRRMLLDLRPSAIINTAAYTAVDKAEEQHELCNAINATAVETLAAISEELDCPLVQVSTDYVFCNAQQRTPFKETDAVAPDGVYAISKYQGELAAARWKKHFVVRTCGLYNPAEASPVKGRNFVDTMLLLARDRDELSIVNDQVCTPTYIPYLADAILFLLSTDAYGTYHVTSQGETTWFDFAARIFQIAGISMKLSAITTEQFGAASPRPPYSVLDTAKYHELGGPAMPAWEDGVQAYLERIQQTNVGCK